MVDKCLYCQAEIVEVISWVGLFYKEPQFLCEKCQNRLKPITGNRCTICSRSLDQLSPELIREESCLDCARWESDPDWKGVLHENTSMFEYNPFLKEYLARYKYRGDYVLAKSFSHQIRTFLKTRQYDHIIPIPLSKERLYERGFNQSTAILEESEVRPSSLLTRTHSEKQSKKNRFERLQQKNVFQLVEGGVEGKTILLFDDIYTTGATLRQAAKLLKEAGAKEISSLTVARG